MDKNEYKMAYFPLELLFAFPYLTSLAVISGYHEVGELSKSIK